VTYASFAIAQNVQDLQPDWMSQRLEQLSLAIISVHGAPLYLKM
jgi:hypothetical protein